MNSLEYLFNSLPVASINQWYRVNQYMSLIRNEVRSDIIALDINKVYRIYAYSNHHVIYYSFPSHTWKAISKTDFIDNYDDILTRCKFVDDIP